MRRPAASAVLPIAASLGAAYVATRPAPAVASPVAARQEGQRASAPRPEAHPLFGEARAAMERSESDKALTALHRALAHFRQSSDTRGEAIAQINLAVVYADTGRPQKALEHFEKALPLWRKIGNRRFETNTLLKIGVTCAATGQPQRALEHFQVALPLFRQADEKRGEANTDPLPGNWSMLKVSNGCL